MSEERQVLLSLLVQRESEQFDGEFHAECGTFEEENSMVRSSAGQV